MVRDQSVPYKVPEPKPTMEQLRKFYHPSGHVENRGRKSNAFKAEKAAKEEKLRKCFPMDLSLRSARRKLPEPLRKAIIVLYFGSATEFNRRAHTSNELSRILSVPVATVGYTIRAFKK